MIERPARFLETTTRAVSNTAGAMIKMTAVTDSK
jgi:hypothetical protein